VANAVASTMIGCMCVGNRVGCCVSVGFFSLHVIDVNDVFVQMYPFPSPWGFFLGLESRFLRAAPLSSLFYSCVFIFLLLFCFFVFVFFVFLFLFLFFGFWGGGWWGCWVCVKYVWGAPWGLFCFFVVLFLFFVFCVIIFFS